MKLGNDHVWNNLENHETAGALKYCSLGHAYYISS